MTMYWNCKEQGHLASQCPKVPIYHICGKTGHLACDCANPSLASRNSRLCNNFYKPGHIAANYSTDKACNNCSKPSHLARDCTNEPVCNIRNISGHLAHHYPKLSLELGNGASLHYVFFCNYGQPGHMSRDCASIAICSKCGGIGHQAHECPSNLHRKTFDNYKAATINFDQLNTVVAVSSHASAASFILAFSHNYILMRMEKDFLYMSKLDIRLWIPAWFVALIKCKVGAPPARRLLLLTAAKVMAKEAVKKGLLTRSTITPSRPLRRRLSWQRS
ncbi:Zinc finger, CCHC-type domain containing protein [Parasponia andersonii]|uniref:Zinc finger, CCHC-type domain containing protein n=1 Tax=Parasponia andersonii TaxID=3476 RepID=A0A2P5C6D5_PARAD|nr:Zinc finger, CCHC-type domain containing protein [Parasponia andersonii]